MIYDDFVVNNGHQRDACSEHIRLYVQKIDVVIGSIINTKQGGHVWDNSWFEPRPQIVYGAGSAPNKTSNK